MKKKLIFTILLLFYIQIISCVISDGNLKHNVEIENRLNDTIVLFYKFEDWITEQMNVNDTIDTILPKDKKILLYEFEYGKGRKVGDSGFDKTTGVSMYFDSLKVFLLDKTFANKDFKLRKEWNFKEIDKRIATYTLVIDTADFE
jgi:hypothetical protein